MNGSEHQSANGRPSYASLPIREDCWSEEATSTLVDAWGDRHLDLNRGNLRQKHWQEVADAVNHVHGANKKARRTDIQCKNRIDTLKKKYKIEKAKILASNGTIKSSWPFYDRLDVLVGSSMPPKKPLLSLPPPPPPPPPQRHQQHHHQMQLALPLPYRKMSLLPPLQSHAATVSVPVAPRSKRPAAPVDDSFFRRNYSAVAAAAAATDSGSSRSSTESRRKEREKEKEMEGDEDGVRELAQAIVKFGEVYEKVEGEKQRHMVELETQRMEFMKSLEFQRMQFFMDWQVQLEKIKRSKRSRISDAYS